MSVLPSAPREYDSRDQNALRQVLTTALNDLNQAKAAIKALQASGGGGGGSPIASSTVTGTVKTYTNDADPIVYRKSDVDSLLGSYQPGPLTGDVTTTGAAATIANNAVTNAKLAQMAASTIKANLTGGSAVPTDATLSALLDALLSSTQGVVLYRGASAWAALATGTSGYVLSTGGAGANPSWIAPVTGGITQLTGDVTAGPGSGSQAATIAASAVTNAKLANMATLTLKANITGGSAAPADSSLSDIIDAAIGSTRGAVLYRGASAWAILAPGTSGYVLMSNGASADPSYTQLSGAYVAAGVGSVKMFPAGCGVAVGKTQTLVARTFNGAGVEVYGQSISWSTSDATKATVSAGVVTGVAAGSATITATCNGFTATSAVTVIADPHQFWYLNSRDGATGLSLSGLTGASYYYTVDGLIGTTAATVCRSSHHWGGRRGLLVEPIYENGITRNYDISHADWTKTSCTVSTTIPGLDGSNNSNGVKPSAGLITLVDGTLHVSINCTSTASVGHGGYWFVSRGTKKYFLLQYKDRSGGFQQAWVDLDTGFVYDTSGFAVYTERVGNGHWLIEWVKTATDTGGAGQAKIAAGFVDFRNTSSAGAPSGGIGRQCTADGTEIAGYIWAAGSTKLRFAGTYIPTTTAVVARTLYDDALFALSIVPGNKTFYMRMLEKGIIDSCLDGTQVLYSVDGTVGQGTKYRYSYLTTAQKNFSFDSTANNSNPNTATFSPLWVRGDEVEHRSISHVGALDFISTMHTANPQITHQAIATSPNAEDHGSGSTPANPGGSYNAQYGTSGTTYVFIGQKSGGTLLAPVFLLEFKIWASRDVTNMYDCRRSGSPLEPVFNLAFVPTGNLGQPSPSIEIGEVQNFGLNVTDRYGTVLAWGSGAEASTPMPIGATRVVTFSSSNTAVATIDSLGNVTGVAAGITTISAYSEGCYTRQFVRVRSVA